MLKKNVKIFCVLRQSPVYGVDYVERLMAQAKVYAPGVPFYCISDVPVPCERVYMQKSWPGWWSKMELFRPDIEGDIFFLDLDTIICDQIWDLLNVGELTMLTDFYQPARLASGLLYLPESARRDVWRRFVRNAHGWMGQYKRGGDQAFIESCYGTKPLRWQEVFPNRVVSYKAHKLASNGVPEGTGIICFHGIPKPRDVDWRVRGLKELPT